MTPLRTLSSCTGWSLSPELLRVRVLPSWHLRATVRGAPRERREGSYLTKLVSAQIWCSVPDSAWVITLELGHGSYLVGG